MRPKLLGLAPFAVLMFVGLYASVGRAELFVEHLDPPVLRTGHTTRVTVHGSELNNSIGLWTTLPGHEKYVNAKLISATPSLAVFDVTLSKEAQVGLHGLRLASRDGLSNVQLTLVDDLPLIARQAGEEPQAIAWPVAAHGTFCDSTIDRYKISVSAGQAISFEVVGNRFGKDADPLLTIRDARGKIIVERDNDAGLFFDTRFRHTFELSGSYVVEVRDARFRGNKHHPYVLRIGQFPADRVAFVANSAEAFLPESGKRLPANPPDPGSALGNLAVRNEDSSAWFPVINGELPNVWAPPYDHTRGAAQRLAASPEMTFAWQLTTLKTNPFASLERLIPTGTHQAHRVKIPCVVNGVLRHPKERQTVWFELAKGQSIWVQADARAINSPVDVDFTIVDQHGREVRRPNDNKESVTAEFTAGNPGVYGIVVRDILHGGSPAHAYQLTIADSPFPPIVQAEVEGLSIPQGSWQPIPLTLSRPAGELRLKLLGAPAGMTLSPDIIPAGKTAFVCRLRTTTGTTVSMNTVRIVATETLPGRQTRDLPVRTQPLIDRQLQNVDLIPIGLREDQRRLPPTVQDRLAVQVTPPSAFDFDVPAEVLVPRYQSGDVPVTIRRAGNYSGEISFTARGGQLGPKSEGRTRVYAEFPTSRDGGSKVNGQIRSLILTNLGKNRIDLTASALEGDRRVSLTRSFELNITSAFEMTSVIGKPVIPPGESTTFTVTCRRLKSFSGPVTMLLSPNTLFEMPESVTIPAGQTSATITVRAKADTDNGRHRLDFQATGLVDGFEEEQRNSLGEVEVKKPEPAKKK